MIESNANLFWRHYCGVKKVKKKKQRYTTFENVVVFPGTVERLVFKAQECVKENRFDLAVEYFEEALQYTEGDEYLLGIYAYSLYEAKHYERAKEICEKLLQTGTAMYFEVMELYLTILMQLKENKQVEKIISTLLDEGVIPPKDIEKFQRLQELNANISQQKEKQDDESIVVKELNHGDFELESFLLLHPSEQANQLHALTFANIRPIIPQLKSILENEATHIFIKSLILILLHEQDVDIEVQVAKFNQTRIVNPSKIGLPTDLPQYKMISNIVNEKLQQEPTVLEMVEYLIEKHSIVTYPFEWLNFQTEEVAESYIQFVRQMFGQVNVENPQIFEFLQELEKLSELQ